MAGPERIAFCAESFEAFMGRFWLENEIWYATYRKTPKPEGGAAYVEEYRRKYDEARRRNQDAGE